MQRLRIPVLMLALVVGLVAAACAGSTDDATTSTLAPAAPSSTTTGDAATVPTNYEQFRNQPTACGAEQPPAATPVEFDAPMDMGITAATTAVITTSCGDITIELLPAMAPATVNSFAFLATEGYFDGTASHRVLPGFMMQAGDPTATGRGGPGYTIPDEFPGDGFLFERGVVAMANAGPGTTGSQFFIMFDTADWMPPNFTVFGTVVDGANVLDAVAGVPLGMAPGSPDPSPSTPLETVYIESVSVDL